MPNEFQKNSIGQQIASSSATLIEPGLDEFHARLRFVLLLQAARERGFEEGAFQTRPKSLQHVRALCQISSLALFAGGDVRLPFEVAADDVC